MENGNCIINLDTEVHQHNNTARLTYFPIIYSICSQAIWLQIQFGDGALPEFSRSASALAGWSA